MEDVMHWADRIAHEVKERCEHDTQLKEIVAHQGFLIYDEKTPSGSIHIGSGRGWVIHDSIAKAMRNIGMKARFVLSSDDIDPFDRWNDDLPENFRGYLGMPFMNIPSPVKGYKSFADYYFSQCTDKFKEFGIVADLESTGQRYKDGSFNKAIKLALDNAEKIHAIYIKFYGKAPAKLPFCPICEKCGKIGTTVAYEWDAKKEIVKYRCSPDFVDWAAGCGHEGECSPYNGSGKLPWKVEWPAKWFSLGVVVEYAGKDHFTKGGSRSIGIAISDEVYGYPPPYPSTGKDTGPGYEFLNVQGKKMSTSKGHGMGFSEVTNYVPAAILRYLLVATRPTAAIDFDPITRNDLILLYDRFDRTERIYFGKEEVSDHEKQKHASIYQFSHIGTIPKKMPPQVPFTLCAVTIQVALSVDKAIELLKQGGHLPEDIVDEELVLVKDRMIFAENWINNFAPEQYRFKLKESVDIETKQQLSAEQKSSLHEIVSLLKQKKLGEKELHNEFYEIAKRHAIEPKDLFRAAYLVLIGKEQGPRLASFLLTIGAERVANLFSKF
jgi:lysyl-tRNA synthetase, class I